MITPIYFIILNKFNDTVEQKAPLFLVLPNVFQEVGFSPTEGE